MSDTDADQSREVEVWNRATGGDPASDHQGDVALAHALRFLGYAEGDGLLTAIEWEIGEGFVGTGAAALAWFGLDDAVSLVAEIGRRYRELTDGDLEGDAHAAAWDALEGEADGRFGLLAVGDRLQAALRTALERRPEFFAADAGTSDVMPSSTVVLAEERPGWAVRIPPQEKLRRTVQAYEAFGVRAEVEDGLLVLWPPDDDAGWELLDEIDRLLEHRYPTKDER